MSIFSMEEPINYDWLIENGFSQRIRNGNNNPHILTKILRYRKPYVYININFLKVGRLLNHLGILQIISENKLFNFNSQVLNNFKFL